MSERSRCEHCKREIFWSDNRGCYLHWSSAEPSCGLAATPAYARHEPFDWAGAAWAGT